MNYLFSFLGEATSGGFVFEYNFTVENLITSLNVFWQGLLAIMIVLVVVYGITLAMTVIPKMIKDKKEKKSKGSTTDDPNKS